MSSKFIITRHRASGHATRTSPLTIHEAIKYFQIVLDAGANLSDKRGNAKIDTKPSTMHSLISNLNLASVNIAGNKHCDSFTAAAVKNKAINRT
ncbi:MAG: hypothetical protein ACMV1B_02100 [Prevotella sp.]